MVFFLYSVENQTLWCFFPLIQLKPNTAVDFLLDSAENPTLWWGFSLIQLKTQHCSGFSPWFSWKPNTAVSLSIVQEFSSTTLWQATIVNGRGKLSWRFAETMQLWERAICIFNVEFNTAEFGPNMATVHNLLFLLHCFANHFSISSSFFR